MSKTISVPNTITIFQAYGLEPLNKELTERGMGKQKEVEVAAMILASGCRSLDEFAATVINLSEGGIDSEEMQAKMSKAFPQHKIGDRHGSHYLSLARNGHLNGNVVCRHQPAKATRKNKKGLNIDVKSLTDKQRKALAAVFPEMAELINAVESK